MIEKVIVKEQVNKVVVSSPGPQGPRGNTILNGEGSPANNLGLTNDFYFDTESSTLYGPKLSDLTWSGAASILLDSGLSNTLTDYVKWDDVAVPGGVASLNSASKVPFNQIPGLELASNNDIEVTGIENKTTLDTFRKNGYGTLRYIIQIIKGSEIVSRSIDIVNDQSNLYLQETEVSSNTDSDLANITLEENNGIISLAVTPITGSVTVRYYRTALKI